MNFITQSQPYIQTNQINISVSEENNKYLDQSQQNFAQNDRSTEYEQDFALEDINFRNQLEMIKQQSDSIHIFKTNMDDFKCQKDLHQANNSSDNIDSPESSSSSVGKNKSESKSPSTLIQQVDIQSSDNQYKKDIILTNSYQNRSQRKSRSGSYTCKNIFSYQQQQQSPNDIQFLSPVQNISVSMGKSSCRENSVRSSSICRTFTKKRSTMLAIRNSNLTLSMQKQPQNGQDNFNISNQQADENKNRALNVIDILSKEKKNQKRNLLKQIYYIRKITNILKQKLDKNKIQLLKKEHYNIINDKAYFYNPIDKRNNLFQLKFFQLFTSLFCGFLRKIGIFSPDGLFIMWLNLITLLIQFFQLIIYPLKSSFQIQELKNDVIYEELFRIFPVFMGLFEIAISFNISYYENGTFVSDRKEIIRNYLKNKFSFDLICVLIVQLNYKNGLFIVDLLFAIFSIKKIIINLKTINEHFQIEQRFSTSYDLMNLCLLVCYMGHYCACGYYYIGMLTSPNWITHYGFSDDPWYNNYVNSLYFTFITMITVGFGDIAPINMYEKLYVVFMTIGTCGIFAYSINTIGRIFSEMALMEAKYRNKKFEITKLMQQRNISKKIQRKVIKFLEYEQSQERESFQKGEEILLKISKSLRDEVNREYFGKFLNDIKLFKLNFSMDFIMKLTSHVKEKTFGPNEIIFSQGDLDRNFYFVCNGFVQLYFNSKTTQNRDDFDLISVGKGSLLGISSFLTGNPKDMSAKSLNGSHLIYCSENDFLQTIKLFESDYVNIKLTLIIQSLNSIYFCQMMLNIWIKLNTFCIILLKLIFLFFFNQEKYCMLRDQINLYKNHQGLPCFSCNKFDHSASNCFLYNLKLDKEFVNFKNVYCPKQMRNKEGRNINRRRNVIQALSHKSICQISLKRLRLFYVSEIYNYSDSEIDDDEDEDEEDDDNDQDESSLLYEKKLDKGSSFLAESQLKKKNITKINLEEKLNDLKEDKSFFQNVKKIKQKDLQQYLQNLNEEQNNNSKLYQTEYESQFQLESEESDSEEDLWSSSQETDQKKFSNQSSLKSQQKTQNNLQKQPTLQNISQNFIQNSPQFSKISSKLIETNIELRNKSPSNCSQQDLIQNTQSQFQNQGIEAVRRTSILKTINQIKSRMSIHQNMEETKQVQCQIQEEGGQNDKSVDMNNSKLNRKHNQETQEIETSPINSKTNLTKKTPSVDINHKRRPSTQLSKKFSIFNRDETSKQSKFDISDNNIQQLSYKLKYSMRQFGQNHVLDFPAKYFEIFDQFDKHKDFSFYFPQSNPSVILKEQRKKTYQTMLMMRYNKLQLNTKQNVTNSQAPQNSDQDTKSMMCSPKKLNGLHHLVIMKQIQQNQQLPQQANQNSKKESSSPLLVQRDSGSSLSSTLQAFNIKK